MKNLSKKNRLSVVMPVYNAAPYLKDSIESVLTQSYPHFEFIIVDDASTDSSYEILKGYKKKDKRIKLYRNKTNLKQGATVTFALQKAKGDFIARMDADDIALRSRFKKQLSYLLENPKTVAIGGQCMLIDQNGKKIGEKNFPTGFDEVYKYILEFCPAQQPSMMFAIKRLPQDFSFYDHGMSPVEDVELLFKLFKYGKVENMPDYLLKYRIHGENSSLKNLKKSFFLTFLSRMRGIFLHGYTPTLKGLVVTFIQLVVVMTLPEKTTYALYKTLKNIKSKTSSASFRLSFPPLYRQTLSRLSIR